MALQATTKVYHALETVTQALLLKITAVEIQDQFLDFYTLVKLC